MRKIYFLLFLLAIFAVGVEAEGIGAVERVLENEGIPSLEMLFDGEEGEAQTCPANAQLTLQNQDGIGAIYLIFDREYGTITLTEASGAECFVRTDGILHKYVDLRECFGYAPEQLTICFSDGEAQVNELYVFAPGAVPEWVQRWQILPEGEADLLLCSTHGDDEQLFFAGLLPWYGAERGLEMQVVYFTDHRNLTTKRVHEMLNGLWNVGIRNYPVFGPYADYYTFDMQDAYRFYQNTGHSEEELLAFVVEQLRRFRPLVAVGHDENGEYGHGMHRMYTDLLKKAVEVSGDLEACPESAEKYGVWDVPKTYLHLYPQNAITMDWDIPMESFDGKTAFEVTRDLGFPSHVSQQKDFAWYFRGAQKATDVTKYSPCQYGLYRTTVGEDVEKMDFFENLPPDPPMETEAPEEYPAATSIPETTYLFPEIRDYSADQRWPIIPAVGTLVLAVMTVFLSTSPEKEKN